MAAPTSPCIGRKLLCNVHEHLEYPGKEVYTVQGDYEYYHYGCDGQDDRGWGCGYRTLQSLCSWVNHQQTQSRLSDTDPPPDVPSIPRIQEALVAMGDKESRFQGSRDWIGSVEVCMCLDHMYDVPCKIIHVMSGKDLCSHFEDVVNHFKIFGSPVMMGGDSDSSSKGIIGVCREPASFLVMDPHYYGDEAVSNTFLQDQSWVKWRRVDEFNEHSFYNLCLPQLKARNK